MPCDLIVLATVCEKRSDCNFIYAAPEEPRMAAVNCVVVCFSSLHHETAVALRPHRSGHSLREYTDGTRTLVL